MITCRSCSNEELTGALFCGKCGAQLIYSENEYPTNVIETEVINKFSVNEIPEFPLPPADATDSIVALHILINGNIIHIPGRDEFSIGRSTKGQSIIPDIDLSTYQAYEAGVSRLHANINIKGSEVSIQDLGSANGTHINTERIEPHTEHKINHGDIVTFGQFKVQVLIKD